MPSQRQIVSQFTYDMLDADATPATLMQIVEHGFEQIAEAQTASRAPLACAAGCAFCCYHPVDITAPEALVMAAYMRTGLTEAEFAAMTARLAANAERIQALSHDEHALAKIPCALLDNGRCGVYAARPFACRAWHSMSAARCEAIFTHGDPLSMIPPLDMELYNVQWDVMYGIAAGIRQVGLDDRPYELHSMLHRALSLPDAAPLWLQGEDVFAGCTPGAFFD
jgi:Fe-S-cluster containining protein